MGYTQNSRTGTSQGISGNFNFNNNGFFPPNTGFGNNSGSNYSISINNNFSGKFIPIYDCCI